LDRSHHVQQYADYTPVDPQADSSFHPGVSSAYYSEPPTNVNEQRMASNAIASSLDQCNVEDPGNTSATTVGVSESPMNQKEPIKQEDLSKSSVNRTGGSPKAGGSLAPRGSLKTAVRSTVHDRSKIAAKKQQRRSNNPSTMETTKASETSAVAATSTDQVDPFTQWYQMMSQYYSQFYPGYQLPQPPGMSTKIVSDEPKMTAKPDRAVKPTSAHMKQSGYLPAQLSYSARPGALATTTTGAPGNFDYAAYYYQYYYEAAAAAAAAQMWTGGQFYPGYDPSGRQTPKLFPTPHVRGGLNTPGILLQILPNRPSDGELARIELLDMSVLANDAVAEATKRAAESGNYMGSLARLAELRLNRDPDEVRDAFSSGASGLESPGRLSSLQAGAGGDDDGEEVRACAAIALAWDRTDHVFYPGPLSRTGTLKADVLVFLRDKLAEIQDRLPTDWESAGLLISFLEFMVKNNGVSVFPFFCSS
uniref:Sec16_C domain-containing protein n=1 Tax=Echinostoma caproni TaxID=27848 RepID=A0A182ZZJ7_9TREM